MTEYSVTIQFDEKDLQQIESQDGSGFNQSVGGSASEIDDESELEVDENDIQVAEYSNFQPGILEEKGMSNIREKSGVNSTNLMGLDPKISLESNNRNSLAVSSNGHIDRFSGKIIGYESDAINRHNKENISGNIKLNSNLPENLDSIQDTPDDHKPSIYNLNTPCPPPAMNSKNFTDVYNKSAGTDKIISSQLHEECKRLRQMNDMLLAKNKQLHDRYKEDLKEKMKTFKESHKKELTELKSEAHKVSKLEERIKYLKNELEKSRASQEHISNIRSALEQEKELDILNLKRDLITQKERQLNVLRQEMIKETEQIRLDSSKRERSIMEDKVAVEEQCRSLTKELEALKIKPDLEEAQTQTILIHRDICEKTELYRLQDTEQQLIRQTEKLSLQLDEVRKSEEQLLVQKSSLEQEVHDLILENKRINSEREESISDIKSQCTKAYDKAVSQIENHYNLIVDKLKRKVRKMNSQIDDLKQSKSKIEAGGLQKEKRISALLEQIDVMKEKSTQEARQLRNDLEKSQDENLAAMKKKYLDTLRRMRDDVAASKQRSSARMQETWDRKKEDLNRHWESKLFELQRNYESKIKSLITENRENSSTQSRNHSRRLNF